MNRADAVIRPVALFEGVEFLDPDSYQSKALDWLRNSDLEPYSDAKLIQRYALACVWFATFNVTTEFTDLALGEGRIVQWERTRGWLTDTDECSWANTLCEGGSNVTGFLEILDLVSIFFVFSVH